MSKITPCTSKSSLTKKKEKNACLVKICACLQLVYVQLDLTCLVELRNQNVLSKRNKREFDCYSVLLALQRPEIVEKLKNVRSFTKHEINDNKSVMMSTLEQLGIPILMLRSWDMSQLNCSVFCSIIILPEI